MGPRTKVILLASVILGTLVWLAVGGIQETKTYYVTVAELQQMGPSAHHKRLRVAGDIETGSLVRDGKRVEFVLRQEQLSLKVRYEGSDPLPDTFREGAQAIADGTLGPDGVFRATRIQAKCASKYEASPGTSLVTRRSPGS